jgi:hypothetical protein
VQELAVLYQKNKELMAGNEIASKRDWASNICSQAVRPLTLLKVILITWFQNIENEETP